MILKIAVSSFREISACEAAVIIVKETDSSCLCRDIKKSVDHFGPDRNISATFGCHKVLNKASWSPGD